MKGAIAWARNPAASPKARASAEPGATGASVDAMAADSALPSS